MKRALAILFAAYAPLVQAEPSGLSSFETRVRLAKAAESDERYHPYPSLMYRRAGRHLARTMRHCIAVSPKPNAKSFVLVADIGVNGKPRDVEVRPRNEVAQCFAAGFSSAIYLKPPEYSGRMGFPITMRISVER